MTALAKYDRLETTGLWRDSPQAQRRDVVVSFGDASIMIRDKTGAALTHWSLAAIERIGTGEPAIYRPGADAGETLEIADPEMIAAIDRIRRSIARKGPHRGRLRLAILASLVIAIGTLGTLWLPGAVNRHALSVLPEATRIQIGQTLMTHLSRLIGTPCDAPLGVAAMERLTARVLSEDISAVHVVPSASRAVMYLPGRQLVLARSLVEDYETPEVVAGFMLAGSETDHLPDPVAPILEFGGIRAGLTLLTTGEIPDEILRDYAEHLLTHTPEAPSVSALVARFKAAKVPLAPYAYALDVTGETTVELIEADPDKDRESPRLLPDGDWLSLQAICGG